MRWSIVINDIHQGACFGRIDHISVHTSGIFSDLLFFWQFNRRASETEKIDVMMRKISTRGGNYVLQIYSIFLAPARLFSVFINIPFVWPVVLAGGCVVSMGSLCDKESNMGKHGVQEKAERFLLRWFARFPFSLSLSRARMRCSSFRTGSSLLAVLLPSGSTRN